MIKDFETYIKEGRMGRLLNTDENGIRKQDDVTEVLVMSYVEPGYSYEELIDKITIRKEGDKKVVDIDGDFYMRPDITEIPFQFGKVTGNFIIGFCTQLESLVGCPKEVDGGFSCYGCTGLNSLEGCPKVVKVMFNCGGMNHKFTKCDVLALCKTPEARIVI